MYFSDFTFPCAINLREEQCPYFEDLLPHGGCGSRPDIRFQWRRCFGHLADRARKKNWGMLAGVNTLEQTAIRSACRFLSPMYFLSPAITMSTEAAEDQTQWLDTG